MQYSPKLKKAAEEIKEILAKHDIAGMAVLHTPGFSEFIIDITPTYSCAWIQCDRIRFKALKKEYDTQEQWKKKVTDTTNMLHHLSTTGGQVAMSLIQASEIIDKAVGAEYDKGGFTSHTTQNN